MKIQKCSVENTKKYNTQPLPQQNNMSFKSGAGLINGVGTIMHGIENGGFLVSFLIQDAIGMTAPRVYTGFLRDKEVTGVYNTQEGFEVLGREGITGPVMMAIAPAALAIAARFGKTTGVNSQLIKKFGNSLKSIITKPEFDKNLLNKKDEFKEVFYKTNLKQMLDNTLGEANVSEELINKILNEVKTIETGARKERKGAMKSIIETINNTKFSTASDLENLNKIKFEPGEKAHAYLTKEAIEAMVKYSNDAISLNKHLNKLDEIAAEDIKNRSIAKRMITNISTMAATIGILGVLPKLYIRHSVAPGAQTAIKLREAKEAQKQEENDNTQGEIAFKGKETKLGKLGKLISKLQKNEKWSSEFEYNGHNFTNTLMTGLSLFGILMPRGLKAYSRAQVDDNGKKDMTEIYEILIRDLSSSLSVVFAVPMLTRLLVSSYENKSGFVLTHKDRTKSTSKQILDLINPYSNANVMTNSELSALYDGVDTKEKMLNFCKYINDNNGDLQKILSKSKHVDEVFSTNTLELSSLDKLDKKVKNAKILEFFEKTDLSNNKIAKLMQGAGEKKINKIVSFARGLNSVPAFISTVILSPVILGWAIPRLTYANTRRLHEKAEQEKEQKVNTAV